jgi:hypothetical protein
MADQRPTDTPALPLSDERLAAPTFAGVYWRMPPSAMTDERLAELRRMRASDWRGTHASHAGRAILSELLAEVDRLRADAARADSALREIDDVLMDGDSPALADLEAAARHEPRNIARTYQSVVEIVADYLAASRPPTGDEGR